MSLSSKKIEEITNSYRKFIINRYKDLPCLDDKICITMENYVPLQLGEEKREERHIEKGPSKHEKAKDRYIDFRVWREEHSIQERYSITPVDVWRALRNKRVVVKGDPGSGKTTLTSYIAYSLCSHKSSYRDSQKGFTSTKTIPTDMIPLFIDLKSWADKSIPLSRYYSEYVLKDSGFEKEIVPIIDRWLKSGKCIILCDGLDEVTTKYRKSLIQSLQNLISGMYGNCHLVVTTRIVGYNNELSGWQHYEIMSLGDEHIKQYTADYLKDKSSAFLPALKKTPQMMPISKNPMLLQILCFVFSRRKLALPTQRVELYKAAVDEMLKLREPEIPASVKKNVLKEIAKYFLEGKEIFEEDELRVITKNLLRNEEEDYKPDDVLKEIVEKSGLLCRFGDGRYIFLHLTFQEYLSACCIPEKIEASYKFIEPVLFSPRFREVIRHTVSMLKNTKDVSRFIEFILSQKPFCFEVLHQPLLLAGLCICDIPDNKAASSLEDKILAKLWRLWKKTRFNQLRDDINRVFIAIIGRQKVGMIITNLIGVFNKNNSFVSQYAAEALGKLGCTDKKVIDALIGKLNGDESNVSQYTAEALGKLGCTDKKIIDALIGELDGDESNVSQYAAEALGKSGCIDKKVIEALVGKLNDNEWSVRECAAEALGELECKDKEVIDALIRELNDGECLVRRCAVEALGKLGSADKGVISALIKKLNDEDEYVRDYVVEALGKLGCIDKKVIDALVGKLNDNNYSESVNAAEALGKLGCIDKKVIDALVGELNDYDWYERRRAAEALGKSGCTDKKIIEALIGKLNDNDYIVRGNAVKALGELGCTDKEVFDALIRKLNDDEWSVRECAAEALGKLGNADKGVINALIGKLNDYNGFSEVSQYAAEALGKLGCTDKKVIEALVGKLNDVDWNERQYAYTALHKLVEKQLSKESVRLPVDRIVRKEHEDARRLLKFIEGLKESPGEQPGDTSGDPQIMRIVGFLEDKLHSTRKPLKILDYGCGKGPLINELSKLRQFVDNSHQYIGVNYGTVEDAIKQARKCNFHDRKPCPCFYTTKEFEGLKKPLEVDLVFIRNVIHEIPLWELGRRFFFVLMSLKTRGKLYILDMCMLPKGESKNVTWENEDFAQFFDTNSLDVILNPYESKSGIPLIAVIITKKLNDIPSERELQERAIKLFSSKKQRTKKAMELYEEGKCDKTAIQYVYLQHQYSNIQRQLDDIRKIYKTNE